METKISLIWTIVFGLVIGVGANLLTPYFARFMAKISSSARERLRLREKDFADAVQHLIDHPLDEINLRIEKNGYYTRTLLFVAIGMIAVIAPINLATVLLVVCSLIGALYFFMRGRKYARLAGTAWDQRKKSYSNVKSI